MNISTISNDALQEASTKLTIFGKHRFFQKAAPLRYSLRNFNRDLTFDSSIETVYLIDASEFFGFALLNESVRDAFSIQGLLAGAGAGTTSNDQLTLVTADMIILRRLFFGSYFEGHRAIHPAHAWELDLIFDRFRDAFVRASSRYIGIVEKLQQASITVEQTKRAAHFLLIETPREKLQKEFGQFIKDFEKLMPKFAFEVLRKDPDRRDVRRQFDRLEALRAAYTSKEIKFFSGKNSIVETIGERLDGFYEKLSAERSKMDAAISDIAEKMYRLLSWRLRPHTVETDAKVLAYVHVINDFCKENQFPVAVKLISRTPSLLQLAASLPEDSFNGAVVHPLFVKENFSSPVAKGGDIPGQIAQLYDRINGAITPVLNQLYREYEVTLRPSAQELTDEALAQPDLDNDSSFQTLESEVADAASKVAKLLCGVVTGAASSAAAADEGVAPEEYLQRITSEVTAKIEGDKTDPQFHDTVKTFFDNLNFLMAKPNVKAAVQQEVANIEAAYVDRFVGNFAGESDKYYFATEDNRVYFRMGWGYMRPVFVFSHPKFKEFFHANGMKGTPDYWMLSKISFSRALAYAAEQASRIENDELLGIEGTFLRALIVAATGHFDMAGQIASAQLRPIRQLLETPRIEGDRSLSRPHDAFLAIGDVRVLVAYRELFLLRHFCSRASAFGGPMFFGAITRDFPRARRDLDHAFLLNREINFRLGTHAADEDRLHLCQASGYFEILIKCWQPDLENKIGLGWQRHEFIHYRALQQQKNYWALSGIIRRIMEIHNSIEVRENSYSQFMYARSLQIALTGLLMVIVDPSSQLVNALLSPRGRLDHANAQVMRDYGEWVRSFRKLVGNNSDFFQSSTIIFPVAEILEFMRDIQFGVDIESNRKKIRARVAELIRLNEQIEQQSPKAHLRMGSFYHFILTRLIDIFKQQRLGG